MDKVIVTREDEKKLAEWKEGMGANWKHALLLSVVENKTNFDSPFDTILSAMVNGYEVEQTPEESVLDYYNSVQEGAVSATTEKALQCARHESKGIVTALNLLRIKIEGVNA